MGTLPSPQQLRYLATLAELRHFGRAARACRVTQSTLSAGVLALERQLRVALIDREVGRRLVFTPAGLRIAELGRAALESLDAIQQAADASRVPMAGPLRLGIIPSIAPFLLPGLLPELRARFPDLHLSLSEDLTERLVAKLAAGQLDLLLVAMPCACEGLETLALARDPLLLALPPGHRLLASPEVEIAALAGESMLLLEDGHCLREQALAVCRQDSGWAGLPRDQNPRFSASSLHTLVQMVQNGLGVTLLPRLAIESGLLAGTQIGVRPLASRAGWRTLGLAWRPRSARASDYRAFASLLRFGGLEVGGVPDGGADPEGESAVNEVPAG